MRDGLRSRLVALIVLSAIATAAVACALVLVAGRSHASPPLWKVGDSWTIRSTQPGGAIAADADNGASVSVYRFRVQNAPSGSHGAWIVVVHLDGAMGPFASGYRLYYEHRGAAMLLRSIAIGAGPKVAAANARGVLGAGFPLRARIDSLPHDASLTAPAAAAGTLPPPLPVS